MKASNVFQCKRMGWLWAFLLGLCVAVSKVAAAETNAPPAATTNAAAVATTNAAPSAATNAAPVAAAAAAAPKPAAAAVPMTPEQFYEGGTSCTPTVDGGRVYTLSKSGDFICVDAAKGTLIRSNNVTKELGLKIPTWGFAGSVLAEGNLLILNAGSAGTAFDKTTGAVVWKSGEGESGYATPLPADWAGERVVAIMGAQTLNVVKVPDGGKVWSFPWKTEYDVNAAAPILHGDQAFVSSGYGHGAALIKVTGKQPAVVWETKKMRNHFNSSILWQGFLYGVDEGQLSCLDWQSGEVKWTDTKFGKGSLMMADGKLIALSEKGELIIAEANPKAFKVLSRAQVLGGKCWTVPVLANGRVYCRNAKGDLVCLDLSPQP